MWIEQVMRLAGWTPHEVGVPAGAGSGAGASGVEGASGGVPGETSGGNACAGTAEGVDWGARERQTQRTRKRTRTLTEARQVFFEHASPRLIVGLGVLAVGARSLGGPLGWSDLVIPASIAAAWPLLEWSAHRWLLHMEPRELGGRRYLPYFASRHVAHHQDPSDYALIFLPLQVVAGAYVAIGAGVGLATGSVALTATTLAAMSGAALVYEWTHFITHTDYRPRSAWYRRIWQNHRLHHYKHEQAWYAFTVPHLDTALGTDPDPRDGQTSETCRTIHRR